MAFRVPPREKEMVAGFGVPAGNIAMDFRNVPTAYMVPNSRPCKECWRNVIIISGVFQGVIAAKKYN
jgi:hypothetical protein